MKFDRMGRRVEYLETVATDAGGSQSLATATNTHHRFVYDGYLCIQRLNAAANNAIDLIFAWDPAETVATRPLMIEKPGACMMHVTHDGNKNVSDLVFLKNGYGVAAHYEYAPFGALTASTRNSSSTAYDFRSYNPFRFSSEYADDALGLVYYNYRHYESVMGRWLSRDPIDEQGGVSLYVFCNNETIDSFDVIGEVSVRDIFDMVFSDIKCRLQGTGSISYTIWPRPRLQLWISPPVWAELNVTVYAEITSCCDSGELSKKN